MAPATTNGNRKWNAKNRVNVALSTENPPQIHWTREFPTYGDGRWWVGNYCSTSE
uniref:Uncharacterized protein n=1 Tax=Anguilla anguilla TaxID=7936 RepID=A0A0E9TFG7_ANGAN